MKKKTNEDEINELNDKLRERAAEFGGGMEGMAKALREVAEETLMKRGRPERKFPW